MSDKQGQGERPLLLLDRDERLWGMCITGPLILLPFDEGDWPEGMIPMAAHNPATERVVPKDAAVQDIADRIVTQDNRATDQPIFVVQEQIRINGVDADNSDGHDWYCTKHGDWDKCSEGRASRLDAMDRDGFEMPGGYVKVGYALRWVHVTFCFTEKGCQDYINANGHNHRGELRIYAEGSFRNFEYRAVREWLIAQARGKGE